MLIHAVKEKLKIRQFDIKTAFLYATLKEEIYLIPPDGYQKPGKLWRLNRSLSGLRQSPRMWGEKFTEVMLKFGLKASKYEKSIFFKDQPRLYVLVYVDDGLIMAETESSIKETLDFLMKEFDMHQLDLNIYRGIEILQKDGDIFIHERKYIMSVLETFNMQSANAVSHPTITGNDKNTKNPARNTIQESSRIVILSSRHH